MPTPSFVVRHARPLLAGGLVTLVAAMALWGLWRTAHHSKTPFLTTIKPAEWILYRTGAFNLYHHTELHTHFRHTFNLSEAPGSAELAVRAFGNEEVWLNGEKVLFSRKTTENWKLTRRTEVLNLKSERNEITVKITNDRGPPAL